MRICSNCKVDKVESEDNFRLRTYANGSSFYNSICKECERLKARKYAEEHKEKRKEYFKTFNVNNPEYVKNWKKNNKKRINKRERDRRDNDINFKLKKNVSRAISHAINKGGNSVIKYLPYTIQVLKKHLESQFNDHMSWENYGVYWHIDHVVPQSNFSYFSMKDDNFTECWALSNLRPLEANQNRIDGATRIRHKK
jgi:hypothetical protein